MSDSLNQLRDTVRAFAAERDWDQFHSPRNLATALAVEAAELLEPFQWMSESEGRELPPATRAAVAQVIAEFVSRVATSVAVPEGSAYGERLVPLAPLQFITVAPAALTRHLISRKVDFDVLGPEFRPCCDKIGFLAIRLSRQGQEEPNLTGILVCLAQPCDTVAALFFRCASRKRSTPS